MDVIRRSIHSGWEFTFADYRTVNSPQEIGHLTFWPAQVPGTNLTDLQAVGLVEDATSATYEDSFAPYKGKDFIYRTTLPGDDLTHKRKIFLCFDGLDTACEIFLNNEKIAEGESAYIGYQFDITGKLQEGDNTLVLLFRSPILEAEKRQKQFGLKFPAHLNLDFMFLRKPAYSFFWDWGPEIPVSGIYRPVYLKAYDHTEIQDFYIRYTLKDNDVEGILEVTAPDGDGATAKLRVAGKEFSAPVEKGKAQIPFQLQGVRLWWPNGEGEPHLYAMEILLEEGDKILDQKHHRIGFRTIEILQTPRKDHRGKRFLFRVNGREIFCRGYNWVPVDNSLPRGYYDRYQRNLDLAKLGNANMLRVWGGGYYEDDEFYRLCDERGIMVWQDGMFACSLYPDTDPHFMELVKAELEYNIKRLRNYTSLVLWCGENENHWGFEEWWVGLRDRFPRFYGTEIYDRLFPELVQELDPDRFYWNGSPYSGEPGIRANDPFYGDTHFWDLHSHCEDFSGYLSTSPSFVSETGIQSLPDLRTARSIGKPEDQHIQSFVFDTRNHFENPAKNDRLIKFTSALFRISEDFDKAVILSNLAHAEYLKYALEHWRSLAYDCSGVLIWQINDCWPAISWSAVDYNLIPKACWYYMKRAFAPDLVGFKQRYSINYDPEVNSRGILFVASEREGTKKGVIEMKVVKVTGEVLETQTFPVEMNGRGAVILGEIALPDYKNRRFDCVVEWTLRWEDGVTTRNLYTFSRPKHMKLPRPQILLEQQDPNTIRVKTDYFAKGVYLFHPDPNVVFEDNYFDLMPGEEREVRSSQPLLLRDLQVYCYHH